MAALGQLVVSLSANIAQFQQSMDKASYLAEKNFNKIQSAAKTAAAAVTGYLALNQVKDAIKAQLDYADQLAKTSQKVGVSTETLSAYAYAAELAGVNFEQLQKSLIFLSKGSVDAARGIGESKDAFDAMGISVKNTDGTVKSNSQLLEEVADKFATYKDSAEKTALAVKIFGKAGADMIPLLNGGRDAIREAKEEAEKFGIIIGGDFAKRAEAVNDNFTRIKKAGEGLSLLLAENLLPKLEKITTAMVQAAKEGGVLKAVLVGIGGVMFESFSDSKTQQINKLNTYLEQAQESWKIFKEQADMTGMTPKLDQQLLKIESRIKTLKEQIDALNKQDVKAKKGEEEKEGKAPGMADEKAIEALKKRQKEGQKIIDDVFANLNKLEFTATQNEQFLSMVRVWSDFAEVSASGVVSGGWLWMTVDKFNEWQESAEKAGQTINELMNQELVRAADAAIEASESVAYSWDSAGNRIAISLDEALDKTEDLKKAALEFGARITSSFEEAILRGARLRDIMQGLLQDILKIATRTLITAPLGRAIEQAIGSAFGQSGTNVIQSAGDWNAAVAAGIPNIQTGSAKALGGPVSFGTSYLVGEKGPEIFTPAMNGTITPNHEIGGGVTVYQNINISTGVAQTVRAEVVGMMPRIMEATKAAVVDSKRRGGSFAKAFS